MKDLTYVVCSKNDNYDPNNLEKIQLTINTNVDHFVDGGLDVEVILVDWASDKPLHSEEWIQKIKFPVNHIYVDKSLLEFDHLKPTTFLEYYAKNVGMRQAQGKYVLLQNSDCINDEDLGKEIVKFIKEAPTNVYGRPTLRVHALWPNYDEYTHYDTIDDKPMGDLLPGDFVLTTRENFIKVGGYDETNTAHRNGFPQTHMDVEILFQFNNHGIPVQFIQGYYSHLYHNKADRIYQSSRNTGGYVNRPTWGFTNAKSTGVVTINTKDTLNVLMSPNV